MSSCRKRFVEYAAYTDTHGVKFVVKNQSTVKRIFWTLCLIGSFGFLGYFFYSRVDFFLRYETTTKVDFTTVKEDIPLMPLIVCMYNDLISLGSAKRLTASDVINAPKVHSVGLDLNRSAVVQEGNGEWFLRPKARAFFKELLHNASAIFSDQSEIFWTAGHLRQIRNEVSGASFWLRRDWRRLVGLLANHSLDVPLDDAADFNMQELHERRCFTPQEIISSSYCSSFTSFRPVKCSVHSIQNVANMFGCFFIDFQPRTDIAAIEFNAKTAKATSLSERHSTTRWKVSSTDMMNLERLNELPVIDGGSYAVKLRKVKRNVKLGPPYSRCGTLNHLANKNVPRYDHWQCLQDCRQLCTNQDIADKHGCRLRDNYFASIHESLRQLKVCDEETTLAARVGHHYRARTCGDLCANGTFSIHPEGCPPSTCDQWQYVYTLEPQPQHILPENATLALHVDRIFMDIEMTTFTETELYSVESLLAELGGTMGLFVGISLLTIVHFIECLLTELGLCCENVANKQSISSSSVHQNMQIVVEKQEQVRRPSILSPDLETRLKLLESQRNMKDLNDDRLRKVEQALSRILNQQPE